jgi:ABC-type Zn uptake system ZnuABC Zn-binding protein ZnuA
MAQNVAGERLKVEPLLARNVDPHSFEPAPGDVRKVAECNVLIVNGAGLEAGFLNRLLQSAGGKRQIIEAAAGLTSRTAREGELVESGEQHHEGDPHFWLNPLHAIHYVENIRDGLSKADPQGAKAYAENAEAYIARLRQLDSWIAEQVQQIPEERRKLVTNHESFGYYADRYGFTIIGTVIPSVSTDAAPSAQQVARLVERIKQAGVKAIFLETGSNPHMAQQIARETGIKVVTELYTHSTTDGPPAPTYIDMLRYDTQAIVAALK